MTESFLEELTEDIDLVFLCSPSNPSGQVIELVLMEQILTRCEEKKIRLVLDECFIEFLEEAQKYTMVKKVTDHPSLFLVQAFTKMYGIPGLRLGYAMTSDAKLRESMQQIRQPWSVSVPAQAAGIEALTEREEQRVQKIRNKIVEEKMRMEKKMREFGIRFIPTKANFFLLYSESSLFERLLEQGVLIRNCENYRGLKKGWYRIAVRTKEENDVLLRALETILSKQ